MSSLLRKILVLQEYEFNIFFRIVFDLDEPGHLYTLLQGADKELVDEFMARFSEDTQAEFRKELAEHPLKDEAEIGLAERSLENILTGLSENIVRLEQTAGKNRQIMLKNRELMKEWLSKDLGMTDQMKGLPVPPLEKPWDAEATLINLPDPASVSLSRSNIYQCIQDRESRRKYTKEPLTLTELSYLLWSTQGVRKVLWKGQLSLRTVPSGGARHPFETYLVINRVEDVPEGVYRYLPIENKLVYLFDDKNKVQTVSDGSLGQKFVGRAAVVFVWSVIPYRSEWRYSISAHKTMLLDAGHLCQNLYLACESLGLGTCAIAAYSQEIMDEFLRLDGIDEFVVYLAPVGRIP